MKRSLDERRFPGPSGAKQEKRLFSQKRRQVKDSLIHLNPSRLFRFVMKIRNIISFYNINDSIFQPIDFGFRLKENPLQTIPLHKILLSTYKSDCPKICFTGIAFMEHV